MKILLKLQKIKNAFVIMSGVIVLIDETNFIPKMDIKQIVLDLCALNDEQEWFGFKGDK